MYCVSTHIPGICNALGWAFLNGHENFSASEKLVLIERMSICLVIAYPEDASSASLLNVAKHLHYSVIIKATIHFFIVVKPPYIT
jgi:hypothetical protein